MLYGVSIKRFGYVLVFSSALTRPSDWRPVPDGRRRDARARFVFYKFGALFESFLSLC